MRFRMLAPHNGDLVNTAGGTMRIMKMYVTTQRYISYIRALTRVTWVMRDSQEKFSREILNGFSSLAGFFFSSNG